MEEISEVSKAILKLYEFKDYQNDYIEYRKEIIQSITLLVQMYFRRYSIDLNQNKINL